MTDPLIASFNNKSGELKFAAPVELTAASEEGKKPTFSIVAYTGVPMNAGGFYTPVIVELSGVKTNNATIPILLDHDSSQIVGQGEASVDSATIRVAGSVMGDSNESKKIVALAKDGFKWQASIGASVTRREFLEAGKKAVVNGREVGGPLMIARESTLQEVSFVAIGADQSTSAAVAASHTHRKATDMNFEQWLEADGWDPAALTEKQQKRLKAAYDAEQGITEIKAKTPGEKGYGGLDEEIQKTRLENARRGEITKVAARFLSEHPGSCDVIEAAARLAIEAKQSPAEFELQMLRDFRNESPVIASRRRGGKDAIDSNVIEAAICQATKLKSVEKDFNDQTLTAADKHFRGGIGLKQLLLHCARENGCNDLDATSSDVMRAAFTPDLRAAASTISLPNILSNVANKFITEAFMSVEDSWRQISAIRPVSDFKQITNHSLTGDLQYQKVGPDGEIKDGQVGEQVYYNQADTYGKRLAITRRDIINDDLGAFAAVAKRLGRGGALAINDVFWTAFMDNSTFFTSGRGNYDDGTDTALDAAGLKAAMAIWDALTDPDGKPLGSTAKFILVPPGQWEPAMALMNSTTVNTGGSSSVARVANNNPWAGMFSVVKSRYLSNSSYTGYSALAWYLLADPSDIPVIETCFLGGKEMPTVETSDMEFSKLGVQFRAYHDFGVTKQEYRGGCKFKGEA